MDYKRCRVNYQPAFKGLFMLMSQNNIGVLYYYGEGVEQDYKEAMKWYKLHIKNSIMLNIILDMYYHG